MRILLTGASSGIGLASVLRLARGGHEVAATVRSEESAAALYQQIQAESLPIQVVLMDVMDEDSVRRGVAEAHTRLGAIDGLINNAGISISDPIETAPMEVAKRVFETNYFGAIRVTQAVLPQMRERQRGVIVSVGSISGSVTTPMLGHYAASKAALASFTQTLGQEVSRFGIRVCIVEPGVTDTPMFSRRSNLRAIDPDSPYLDDIRFLYTYFKDALNDGLTPDHVAAIIEKALTTESKQIRYLVGEGAKTLFGAKHCVTDEMWVHDFRRVLAEVTGGEST